MEVEQNAKKLTLTNLQREILKLYKAELSEAELIEVTHLLSDFLTKRAIKLADEVWDEQLWDEQKLEELLQTKMRIQQNSKPCLIYSQH